MICSKKWFYLVTFFCVLQLKAELSFIDIKGIHALISPSKEYVSPLNGLIWWNNNMVQNLYRYGNETQTTIQLIKNMFHLQYDGITFGTTVLPRNAAYYFKPSTIAVIITHLDKQMRGQYATIQEFYTSLLTDIIHNLHYNRLLKEAAEKRKQLEMEMSERSPVVRQYLTVVKLNQEVIQLANDAKKASGQERKALETLLVSKKKEKAALPSLAQLKKELDVKEFLKQQYNHDLTKESLIKLVTNIVKAQYECSAPYYFYLPFTVHHLLLAFLWKKAQSRQDFKDFAQELHNRNPTLINKNALDLFTADDRYTKEDFINIKRRLTEEPIQLVQDYEKIIFYCYFSRIGKIPPIIKPDDAVFKGHEFPDCVETAIRNFFNIVLFDETLGIFNINYLLAMAEKYPELMINRSLVTFYQENNDPFQAQLKKVHNQFAAIVSELARVAYKIPADASICEIKPTLNNILAVIHHLILDHNDSFEKMSETQKLEILEKVLSSDNKSIEISKEESEDITIILNDRYTFDWYITPEANHSFIELQDTQEHKENTIINIIAKIPAPTNSILYLLYNNCISFIPESSLFDNLRNSLPMSGWRNQLMFYLNMNKRSEFEKAFAYFAQHFDTNKLIIKNLLIESLKKPANIKEFISLIITKFQTSQDVDLFLPVLEKNLKSIPFEILLGNPFLKPLIEKKLFLDTTLEDQITYLLELEDICENKNCEFIAEFVHIPKLSKIQKTFDAIERFNKKELSEYLSLQNITNKEIQEKINSYFDLFSSIKKDIRKLTRLVPGLLKNSTRAYLKGMKVKFEDMDDKIEQLQKNLPSSLAVSDTEQLGGYLHHLTSIIADTIHFIDEQSVSL